MKKTDIAKFAADECFRGLPADSLFNTSARGLFMIGFKCAMEWKKRFCLICKYALIGKPDMHKKECSKCNVASNFEVR